MADALRLSILTPHEVIFDGFVGSARVPVESGQVGLRPRVEPMVLAIEPGLVVLRMDRSHRFVATAGGLLRSDRTLVVLYTPFAAVGASGREVLDLLERTLATPDSDLTVRRELGELERHILKELGDRRRRRRE